ncbi:A24 family peptidase [Marinobacterium sp. BA1]|uniref:prepilin peptidase n=1 Tax=Marinobacterium sp. BA1 TaxID=3138931 RepID=UPI0034E8A4C4
MIDLSLWNQTLLSQWRMLPELPLFGFLVGVILGGLLASFLNVVVYRLPKMRYIQAAKRIREQQGFVDNEPQFNLAFPSSNCPNCHHKIRWYENIPVFSWFLLWGRCSQCGSSISKRYPIIEGVGAMMGAVFVIVLGDGVVALLALCTAITILGIALILYDQVEVPGGLWVTLWSLALVVCFFRNPTVSDAIPALVLVAVVVVLNLLQLDSSRMFRVVFQLSAILVLWIDAQAAFNYMVILGLLATILVIYKRFIDGSAYVSTLNFERAVAFSSCIICITMLVIVAPT